MATIPRVMRIYGDDHIAYPRALMDSMPHTLCLLLANTNTNWDRKGSPFADIRDGESSGLSTLQVDAQNFMDRYTVQVGHLFAKSYEMWGRTDNMHVAVGVIGMFKFPGETYWADEATAVLIDQVESCADKLTDYCASHDIKHVYLPWEGLDISLSSLHRDQDKAAIMYKDLYKRVVNRMCAILPDYVSFYQTLPHSLDMVTGTADYCC